MTIGDGAFTDLELNAGIHGIFAMESPPPRHVPKSEIIPTLTRDQLLATIVGGLANLEQGVEVGLVTEPYNGAPHSADLLLQVVSDLPDQPLPSYSIGIDFVERVSITFLIDLLRANRVPLLSDNIGWLAWDESDQLLKTEEFYTSDFLSVWRRARPSIADRGFDQLDEQIVRVLHRAALSDDHGHKPLIVLTEQLRDALAGRLIDIHTPSRIAPNALGRYALVYVDDGGRPRSLKLEDAAPLGLPVTTRVGNFHWSSGTLVGHICDAGLLAGSFEITRRFAPGVLRRYRLRDQATIFQPAIERIGVRSNYDRYRLTDAEMQQCTADEEEDTIYLTVNAHPLASRFIGTPQLSSYAASFMKSHGQEVPSDHFMDGPPGETPPDSAFF